MSFSRSTLRRFSAPILIAGAALLAALPPRQPVYDAAAGDPRATVERSPNPSDRDAENRHAGESRRESTPTVEDLRRHLLAREGLATRLLSWVARSPAGRIMPSARFAGRDPDRAAAAERVGLLGVMDRHRLAPSLVQALRLARLPGTVEAVHRALILVGPDTIPWACPLVLDSDETVCRRGLAVLEQLLRIRGGPGDYDRELVGVLRSPLQSADPRLVLASTESLGALGSAAAAAVPDLLNVLRHAEPDIRSAAATALGRIGHDDDRCVPALTDRLSDSIDDVRTAAAAALGGFGIRAADAIPALAEAAASGRTSLALASTVALGRVGVATTGAREALVVNLGHREAVVRAATATSLGRLGPGTDDTARALGSALADPDEYVRRAAARALGSYGVRAQVALPDLIAALRDPAESVRIDAAKAIGAIGPLARSAIPHLEAARNNNQSVMNPPVLAALGRIAATSPSAAEGSPSGLPRR